MQPTLLLLGHFPPPRGGVAAHLERLRARLAVAMPTARFASFGEHDPTHPETLIVRRHPVRFALTMLRGARLLHYHTDEGDWKAATLVGLWCLLRGQRFVLTLHSFRDHPFLHHGWSRAMMRFILHLAQRVVCISDNLRDEFLSRLPIDPSRVVVIPSFIPPSEEERRAPAPDVFLRFQTQYPATIAFNAFAPTMYHDEDLYGTEILMDAFEEIAAEFPEAGLFMTYMRLDDSPLARRIRHRADALGDRALLVEQQHVPFIPELLRSSVFVRTTLNDGGPSLSLLEALCLGRWTIASDAVPRPEACLRYHARDPHDLARALREVLTRVRAAEQPPCASFPDAADALLKLYARL